MAPRQAYQCDRYSGYPELTDIIQRNFIHILCKSEKVSVTSKKPEDEARYDLLLDLYLDAKKIKALAPFTMSVFLQRAYAIGASYEHLEFQTHLLNAIPDLFTFSILECRRTATTWSARFATGSYRSATSGTRP